MTINTKWSEDTRIMEMERELITMKEFSTQKTWLMISLLTISYLILIMHFLNITNIFDENYETAKDYSQMERSFKYRFKKSILDLLIYENVALANLLKYLTLIKK